MIIVENVEKINSEIWFKKQENKPNHGHFSIDIL